MRIDDIRYDHDWQRPWSSWLWRLLNTQKVPSSILGGRKSREFVKIQFCCKLDEMVQKEESSVIRDGTRTHNLRCRRPTPYPLGHTDSWNSILSFLFEANRLEFGSATSSTEDECQIQLHHGVCFGCEMMISADSLSAEWMWCECGAKRREELSQSVLKCCAKETKCCRQSGWHSNVSDEISTLSSDLSMTRTCNHVNCQPWSSIVVTRLSWWLCRTWELITKNLL